MLFEFQMPFSVSECQFKYLLPEERTDMGHPLLEPSTSETLIKRLQIAETYR